MSIELQLLDRNCNDCKFMVRDLERVKNRVNEINEERKRIYGNKVQPIRSINQGAGHCEKFNKPVDFIPATCHIHTQRCFQHRRTP